MQASHISSTARLLLTAVSVAIGLSFAGRPVGSASAAEVITYPFPEGVISDPEYEVLVNGKAVHVWNAPVAAIASFEFSGSVDVEIKPKRDVRWVDVRPLSRGVKARIADGRIRFKLTKPGNFSIELNKEPKRHSLFLFANPIESDPPKPDTAGVHYFAAGRVHRPGLIKVESGETVYVAGGAIVEGSIVGSGVSNVKLRGRGILDGTNLRAMLKDTGLRPHFISLQDCRDVDVEGLVLSNGPTWQFVPVNCDGLTVKNIKIVSENGGDDGIDIVRTRNVKISDSFFHTKDDNIVIKAMRDYPRHVTSSNIEVFNSVFWNTTWGNALEIGFELQADRIFDVVYRDSDVIHVEDGAVFSIHNGDYATVENIQYRNIRVEDAKQKLFDFSIFLTQYSADRPASKEERDARYMHGAWDGVLTVPELERAKHAPHRGKIRNVLIDNIQLVGQLPFSLVAGFDAEHNIEGIVVKRLTLRGKPLRNGVEANFVTEFGKVQFR